MVRIVVRCWRPDAKHTFFFLYMQYLKSGRLGSGGQGTVHAATLADGSKPARKRRKVAVKEFDEDTDGGVSETFLREIDCLQRAQSTTDGPDRSPYSTNDHEFFVCHPVLPPPTVVGRIADTVARNGKRKSQERAYRGGVVHGG